MDGSYWSFLFVPKRAVTSRQCCLLACSNQDLIKGNVQCLCLLVNQKQWFSQCGLARDPASPDKWWEMHFKQISSNLSKCTFLDLTPDRLNPKLIRSEFQPSTPPSTWLWSPRDSTCALKFENHWSRKIPLPLLMTFFLGKDQASCLVEDATLWLSPCGDV